MKNHGDPTSPGNKEMVFGLRNSNIVISSSGTKSTETATPAKPEEKVAPPAQALAADDSNTSSSAAKVKIAFSDNCNKKINIESKIQEILKGCLSGASANPVATLDTSDLTKQPDFYTANWEFYYTQSFSKVTSSKVVGTDPLMVKSIAVDYKNPIPATITSTGTNAAAGFAIAGPWGAAGAAIIGLAARETGRGTETLVVEALGVEISGLDTSKILNNICKEDKVNSKELNALKDKKAELYLPVTVLYAKESSIKDCWHTLPNNSPDAKSEKMLKPDEATPFSGWLYRIQPREPEKILVASLRYCQKILIRIKILTHDSKKKKLIFPVRMLKQLFLFLPVAQ